jgi:hypothetical protein
MGEGKKEELSYDAKALSTFREIECTGNPMMTVDCGQNVEGSVA